MKYTNKQKGSSLVEVLIYVAIVAIIGTVLTGYFVVAITSEAEHAKRNAVNNSIENITTTLKYDLARGTKVGTPGQNGESTSTLEIMTDDGVVKYATDQNSIFIKQTGTTTVRLSEESVRVGDVMFKKREHYENRLNSTTTSIELRINIKNRQAEQLNRTLNITFLVGKDSL